MIVNQPDKVSVKHFRRVGKMFQKLSLLFQNLVLGKVFGRNYY